MTEYQTILAFATVVALIVTSPGPNLFLVVRNSLRVSNHLGVTTALGICTAILCHATLSVAGVGALIATSKPLFTLLKVVGSLYLIWLGFVSLRAAIGRKEAPDFDRMTLKSPSRKSAFMGGFATNMFNPKPALFYLSAFPQFLDTTQGSVWSQGLVLGLVHALIAFVWYSGVATFFRGFSSAFESAMFWKTIQGVSGLALIYFGFKLLVWQSPR